jgi:hypothetical protein
MPDLTITPPHADPARHRHAPAARATQDEVRAAAERAAGHADGLAILREAPLECAAVLLGLDPLRLERVRAALADPDTLADALRAHAHARDRAASTRRSAPAGDAPVSPPGDAAALLEAAGRRAGGLEILLEAPAECAAILFSVHPALVLRARVLAGRGAAPFA